MHDQLKSLILIKGVQVVKWAIEYNEEHKAKLRLFQFDQALYTSLGFK